MKSTVLVSEMAANPSAVIARAEVEGLVPISRSGRTVAFVVGREKLAALLETMELQKDPGLMRLIREDRAGRLAFSDVEE
jgi:antitoxin YefM